MHISREAKGVVSHKYIESKQYGLPTSIVFSTVWYVQVCCTDYKSNEIVRVK